MTEQKGKFSWFYAALGCGCPLLLIVIALVGIAAFSLKTAQSFRANVDQSEQPFKRAEEARKILGYEVLPEGYVPAVGMSVPFLFRLAVLANEAPNEEGDFDESIERAFFYFRLSAWITRDDDLRGIFEGRGDPSRVPEEWDQTSVRVRGRESINEGSVIVDGRDIRYAAQRGELLIDNTRIEGILAVIVVKCDEGERDGLGGWLLPDPDPEAPIKTAQLAGTPADPQALTAFLSQFELCL